MTSPDQPTPGGHQVPLDTTTVLARLTAYRSLDAPTHGGRVLSYVYDSGLKALDELAARAASSSRRSTHWTRRPFPRSR